MVDISEEISIIIEDKLDKIQRKLDGEPPRKQFLNSFNTNVFEVGDEISSNIHRLCCTAGHHHHHVGRALFRCKTDTLAWTQHLANQIDHWEEH